MEVFWTDRYICLQGIGVLLPGECFRRGRGRPDWLPASEFTELAVCQTQLRHEHYFFFFLSNVTALTSFLGKIW